MNTEQSRRLMRVIWAGALLTFASVTQAGVITLQNATATFSQGENFVVGHAIDAPGSVGPGNIEGPLQPTGWAIWSSGGEDHTLAQTAAFETDPFDPDLPLSGVGTALTVTLDFQYEDLHWGANSQKFNLGRFRLSVTTDDRSTFADGSASGGDVTANWVVLDPSSASSTDTSTSFTELADKSLLANADSANLKQTYTVSAQTALTGITGILLEALEDTSLADVKNGPGRFPLDGNFVLTTFSLEASPLVATPEPTTLALLGLGLAGLGFRARKKKLN